MGKFSVKDVLLDIIGYKGLPYPGVWLPTVSRSGSGRFTGKDFDNDSDYADEKTTSDKGSVLRKKDAQGRYYFMPVVFEHKGKDYEIPNAVISFTGKKNVVETAMVGRKGSVKELISIDDYEISIQGIASSDDFPEAAIAELNELYTINEAITLKCALTDIFMEEDDRVIIRSIDISDMKGSETFQVFKIDLVTDRSFELTIE